MYTATYIQSRRSLPTSSQREDHGAVELIGVPPGSSGEKYEIIRSQVHLFCSASAQNSSRDGLITTNTPDAGFLGMHMPQKFAGLCWTDGCGLDDTVTLTGLRLHMPFVSGT